MSSTVPNTTPAAWSINIQKGATWPGTTVSMSRDGEQVIPVAAVMLIRSPEGTLLVTNNATIDGGGVMTIPEISAATTAAYTWEYGNLLLRVTEGSGAITDLLAGNATVINRSD